jgi:hypothetical protein
MEYTALFLVLGFIHLRREVMMVKEEAFAKETPRQAKEPIGVGRVTRMDDIKASTRELDA